MLKPRQVRVYLQSEELEDLESLSKKTGLRDTVLLGLICNAGLRAVKLTNGRLNIPLEFKQVSDQPS
jgi:hypothetical protein